MRVHVTLSKKTIRSLDKLIGKKGSRSAFIERVVREYVLQRQREIRDAHEVTILNRNADHMNAFIADVLQDQASIDDILR